MPASVPTIYPVDSCRECERPAAGRCPRCRHGLCIDHFPLDQHGPCAARLERGEARRLCYVCGTPVTPQQWSAEVFAHYTDAMICAGCGRYICDARHTRRRDQVLQIRRDGIRSNRYHVTLRYCDVCAPLRRFGGLVGTAWWLAGLGVAGATAIYLFAR
ncbi:MAG TPA: hypothetical protein VIC85_06670 [Ktedonobacterales bacterium]|jgi:hypothetical protein